jgi:hypothetical protein
MPPVRLLSAKREERVALADMDLIDADGAQSPEFTMRQPPLHDVLHRMAHSNITA